MPLDYILTNFGFSTFETLRIAYGVEYKMTGGKQRNVAKAEDATIRLIGWLSEAWQRDLAARAQARRALYVAWPFHPKCWPVSDGQLFWPCFIFIVDQVPVLTGSMQVTTSLRPPCRCVLQGTARGGQVDSYLRRPDRLLHFPRLHPHLHTGD